SNDRGGRPRRLPILCVGRRLLLEVPHRVAEGAACLPAWLLRGAQAVAAHAATPSSLIGRPVSQSTGPPRYSWCSLPSCSAHRRAAASSSAIRCAIRAVLVIRGSGCSAQQATVSARSSPAAAALPDS